MKIFIDTAIVDNISSGKHLLRFVYQGKGKVSFYKFNLI